MAPRPVFLPKFGRFLVELRTARGWKQVQAIDIAKAERIDLGYQAYRWLEEGKIKSPDPDLLRAVAALYELAYEDVAALCAEEQYGIALTRRSDLVRQPGDPDSDPHQNEQGGGSDVPASARVSFTSRVVELEQAVAERDALIREVSDAARLLMRRLALGEEELHAQRAKPARGGSRGATRRRPA